ncbi:MAG: hypothetical protein NT034_02675 [Candidatus Magasanikbacteria bacterium]|nr:hypothetical protein [Candidatus Magasanikbacteria bacterium]
MFKFIKVLVVIVVVIILICLFRTWQVERQPSQSIFLNGKSPKIAPDGLYIGSVEGHQVSWRGKKFDETNHSGINIFENAQGNEEKKYSFVTGYGTGVRDKNLEVFKIDYDIDGNPFWLRAILDEIVQISPTEYLGKVHIRIIPGLPFTFGYFKLSSPGK